MANSVDFDQMCDLALHGLLRHLSKYFGQIWYIFAQIYIVGTHYYQTSWFTWNADVHSKNLNTYHAVGKC